MYFNKVQKEREREGERESSMKQEEDEGDEERKREECDSKFSLHSINAHIYDWYYITITLLCF